MKNRNAPKAVISLLLMFLMNPAFIFSQKEADIKNMVASAQYIFVAEYAIPMTGRTVALTSEYDLTVSKDSIIAYLPYYGRAYQAPLDPSQGGIKFTSSKFEYQTVKAKKNGWDISIVIKDQSDNGRLALHVASNGRATLQVSTTFRQPITFTGYIKENPLPKKAF
jgi:hypothetical protein